MRVEGPHQYHPCPAAAGYDAETPAVDKIRNKVAWSAYVVRLVANLQEVLRRHHALDKLRFLLYGKSLTANDADHIRRSRPPRTQVAKISTSTERVAGNPEPRPRPVIAMSAIASRNFQHAPSADVLLPAGPPAARESRS